MKNGSIKKKPEEKGFNQSFFTTENTKWYNYVVNWLPNRKKPLVFLPCASAAKTRAKYGKKMFSHSTTHQLMSSVTRCELFEKVVLSEPCTIIPYALEGQHPDYNIPPEDLTIQDEQEFVIRLAFWLILVKNKQPKRKFVYYIGGTHHYFILKLANLKAKNPFKIIYKIPKGGTKNYSPESRTFKEEIMNHLNNGIIPEMIPVSLKKHINSRGRYTNRKFWESINVIKNISRAKTKPIFDEKVLPIANRNEYFQGFLKLYPVNAIKEIKIEVE
jgi:hypothetical protein